MKRRGQCSVKIKEGQRTRRKEEVILVIVVYHIECGTIILRTLYAED